MKRNRIIAMSIISAMALSTVACSSSTDSTTTAASSIDATDASSALVDSVSNVVESIDSETEIATEETISYADLTREDVYGSQFPQYIDHQYYFDGEAVPLSESNFYLIHSFDELNVYAQYGYYAVTYEGFLDLAAEIPPIDGEEVEYNTYGEFLIDYTEQVLHSTLIICKFCEEEGLTLDDATVEQINSIVDSLEEEATPNGITVDEYVQLFYGDGASLEGLKQALYNYYLADYYTNHYIDTYELTEEDALTAVPIVRYALYAAPAESSTDEQLAAAEALANDTLAQCAGDIDAFPEIGRASEAIGDSLQYGEINVVPAQYTTEFEEWAWDPARTDGELDVIYAEDFGYFVVGFVGRDKTDVAIRTLGDYVSSLFDEEGYELTTDPYAPAVPVEVPETEATTSVEIATESTVGTSVLSADDLANVGTTETTKNSAGNVALIILACVGGAAILGLAGVGAASIFKNNKSNKEVIAKAYEESSKDSDDSDDSEEE